MNRRDNPLISGIVSFIGIDYNLLKKSGEDNIAKFYLSGFFVLLIFAISFFSVFYAFDLMFHKWYAEFLLATFSEGYWIKTLRVIKRIYTRVF